MPKTPAAPTPLTRLFQENLRRLMQADPALGSQPKVAKAARIAQRSVGRILAAEQSPTLDTVYKLAQAFDQEPWQMLIHGLEPNNPPITKQTDDRQREMFERFRKAAEDLAHYQVHERKGSHK
jgi:transcriptional regulator with XRE-family HTH domain